ncbi:MAG: L-threonylcarbamoyladenylate synthase [Flavobacteriaceae bacterium]|nr:L-threonylcarbamoyladenylate synthase [Flavobacteriaceae bacterium]
MKTLIFDAKNLKAAADLLIKGELVAFPTETVYGLGANALDASAVKKIFIAKNRPADNPLIIHIATVKDLYEIANVGSDKKAWVEKLTNAFWPGPLTIILNRRTHIPDEVTAGLDSVAVRMPQSRIARKLIKLAGVPIAAPSANLSGKPSGTRFKHVLEDFDGKIAGIVKSKGSKIGLESTVLDLTTEIPTVLRPGGLSVSEIEKVLPEIRLSSGKVRIAKSPGMKYQHYAPVAKVVLFEINAIDRIPEYLDFYKKKDLKTRVIKPDNIKDFNRNLYEILRKADTDKVDVLLMAAVSEAGIGLTVMNRLRKCATEIIER